MGLNIGTNAEDYVAPEIDPDDIWIKGFKTGETKVHFLHPITKAVTYREHYDGAVRKFVPCLETPECKACQSPNERTRKRQRRYAFNALNDKGMVNVFKIGKKFYDRLVRIEQRGKLLGYDYTVVRVGSSMEDTDYDAEIGDKNDIDTDGLELYDLKKVLGDHYLGYLEALAGDENEDSDGPAGDAVTGQDKPKKTWDDPFEDGTTTLDGEAKGEVYDPSDPPEDWPGSRLKEYCDKHDIEYPLKATKSTLIPLVEQHLGVPANA